MTSRFRKLSWRRGDTSTILYFVQSIRYRIFKDAIVEYVRQQLYQLCKQKEGVVVLELNVQPTMCTW